MPFETTHYRGGQPMMADLITGRVDFSWPTLSTSRSYLAEKKLHALALDADARWPRLPDVPTLTELGYGKEKVASWFALAAPAAHATDASLRHTIRKQDAKTKPDAKAFAQAAAHFAQSGDRSYPARASYVIVRRTLAGAPAAIERGGRSVVTTEFAPFRPNR